MKSTNCRLGKEAMERFCEEHDIAFDICGKVIVAVDESELPAMENIYQRGQQNGVACEKIDQSRLNELEPHAAGIQAIHVPAAGIVDYKQVPDVSDEVEADVFASRARVSRLNAILELNSALARLTRAVGVSSLGEVEP